MSAKKATQNEKEIKEPKASKTSYIVEVDFYSNDSPKQRLVKGRNVSHFDEDRLKKLVEKGIVKEVKA